MSSTETRLEHDLLGYKTLPASAYYGVHTLRAGVDKLTYPGSDRSWVGCDHAVATALTS
jgi:aspartate ammonia-lyase